MNSVIATMFSGRNLLDVCMILHFEDN